MKLSQIRSLESNASRAFNYMSSFVNNTDWLNTVKYVDDLENTDNAMLSFITTKNKGTVTIKLNGEIIYDYDINTLNVNPIELKKPIKIVNEIAENAEKARSVSSGAVNQAHQASEKMGGCFCSVIHPGVS